MPPVQGPEEPTQRPENLTEWHRQGGEAQVRHASLALLELLRRDRGRRQRLEKGAQQAKVDEVTASAWKFIWTQRFVGELTVSVHVDEATWYSAL